MYHMPCAYVRSISVYVLNQSSSLSLSLKNHPNPFLPSSTSFGTDRTHCLHTFLHPLPPKVGVSHFGRLAGEIGTLALLPAFPPFGPRTPRLYHRSSKVFTHAHTHTHTHTHARHVNTLPRG